MGQFRSLCRDLSTIWQLDVHIEAWPMSSVRIHTASSTEPLWSVSPNGLRPR